MKIIQVKAEIGDIVWFMMDNKITSSEVYSIQVYNTVTWYTIFGISKSRISYKFWRNYNDTFLKQEEDIFLSKEELIKSLGEEK